MAASTPMGSAMRIARPTITNVPMMAFEMPEPPWSNPNKDGVFVKKSTSIAPAPRFATDATTMTSRATAKSAGHLR